MNIFWKICDQNNMFGILNFAGSESESEESDSEDSGEDSDHRRRDSSYSEESDDEERGQNEEYAYPEEHDKRYFIVRSRKKNCFFTLNFFLLLPLTYFYWIQELRFFIMKSYSIVTSVHACLKFL